MNDIFEDSLLDDDLEEELESTVPEVSVVNAIPVGHVNEPGTSTLVLSDNELASQAAQKEMELRKLEMAEWAEKKKILKGQPKIKELNRVWNKLRKGYPLVKALRGVVSVATWHKWREEYPEIAAMETQCREERVEYLQERIKNVAEQENRTRVGEVSRDKLMIDAYQSEIDRLDRLTQVRNNQLKTNGFGVVNPIQINFSFGKKKQ